MTKESNPLNTSGIEPFEFKVLVRPDEVKKVSKGGIHYTQPTVDAMQFAVCKGTMIALSPLAFNYDEGITDSDCPQPGARVLFAKYAGGEVEGRDGKTYRIMSDKDIMAFLTDETVVDDEAERAAKTARVEEAHRRAVENVTAEHDRRNAEHHAAKVSIGSGGSGGGECAA
jgi:co-chaperonin GroES (HSP10)